jgi:hypothetical protein
VVYFPEVSLGLELVLTSPGAAAVGCDELLGGGPDVLEDKAHRGDLAHLGDLAHFALYRNDRQFTTSSQESARASRQTPTRAAATAAS